MINNIKIGQQIYKLRKEKGLSQEALADILNVSPQAISKWENAKALPETATLPLLAKALDTSIDSILLPQELHMLSAVYTDGKTSIEVTGYLNRLIIDNGINILVNKEFLHNQIPGDRIKYLVIKYQNPKGVYFEYASEGDILFIDTHSKGYETGTGLKYLYAAYGNKKTYMDAMHKLEHYKYFGWNSFTVNHELFPSPPDNDGTDYLSIVYINDSDIHVVSCAEGERLSFNRSRTNLYVENSDKGSLIIENIRSLGFGKDMDCSWAGSLFSALESMGKNTTYEEVMGASGACWRIAFTPVWDYSSVDGVVAYDYATPGYAAYGYTPVWGNRIEKNDRKKERQNIMNSIDNNKPPIAINLRVAPEWGVITGYLDDGKRLLCRSYFDDEIFIGEFSSEKEKFDFQEEMKKTNNYLYVDKWPFIIIHFSEKGSTPSASQNFINSLKIKLDSMSIDENRGYKMGYDAYEAWREGLLDEEWYKQADVKSFSRRLSVNHFCMLALVDARRCAAAYLNKSVDLSDDLPKNLIIKMADLYTEISRKLTKVFKDLPDDHMIKNNLPKKVWTQVMRKKQADLLDSIAILERKGDDLAEKICSKSMNI